MSSAATATVPTDLSPTTTLAIILGASNFPKTSLSHPPSFSKSASEFRGYLTREDGLGIPGDNVLNLFDTVFSPDVIQEEIAAWLGRRRAALEQQGAKPRDLIFYYVGHGSFSNPDQQYILAIKATRKNYEGVSSVKIIDLGTTLTEAAFDLRRYLILDCCFAAAAVKSLMAPVNDLVHQKTLEAFPPSGTTLLCASDAHDSAEAPPDLPQTIFSGTMLCILSEGDRTIETGLSMNALGTLVRNRIREKYKNYSGLPEVHTPVQNEGNIAAIPLFPNAANRPRTLAEQIQQLGGRFNRIEQELNTKLSAAATTSDLVELKKQIEEIAGTVKGIQTLASTSRSQTPDHHEEQKELWDTMPSYLRVRLRTYHSARLNGLIWLALAIVLFLSLMVGYLRHVPILGNRWQVNPIFWCVFIFLIYSCLGYMRGVEEVVDLRNEVDKWLKLEPLLAASTARMRELFGGLVMDNTLLLFATLLFLATTVAAITLSIILRF